MKGVARIQNAVYNDDECRTVVVESGGGWVQWIVCNDGSSSEFCGTESYGDLFAA